MKQLQELIVTPEGCFEQVREVPDDYFPPPSEPAPQPTPMEALELAIAELAELQAQQDLENKLAIAELAELQIGGM